MCGALSPMPSLLGVCTEFLLTVPDNNKIPYMLLQQTKMSM